LPVIRSTPAAIRAAIVSAADTPAAIRAAQMQHRNPQPDIRSTPVRHQIDTGPTSDRHRPDIRSTPARHQNPRSWTAIRGPRSLQIARVPPISGQKPPVLRRKTCPKPAARGLRTEGLGHVSHEYSLVISNEP